MIELATPRTAREPTVYLGQSNRCPHCGHRLSVALGRACAVLTGDGSGNESGDRPCGCRRHFRRGGRVGESRPIIPRRAIGRCSHRLLGPSGAIVAVCMLPLRFVGIRGEDARAERWYVGACGFYTVLNALGTVERITNNEPRRGYFNHNHDECKKRSSHCIAG